MTITFRYGLAAWLAVLVHQAALAQAFPSRSISLVVPNPPGSSGNLAYQQVARSAKDGHSILVSYSGYHMTSLLDVRTSSWVKAIVAAKIKLD